MLNIPFAIKSFTLTLLFVSLSRMRNLLVTPPRVPLLLSLTTTQKMVGSSAGVPTPSATHLWRNASPSRGSQAARTKLYYTDNSLLTQNCYRAGNLYFTAFPAFTWKQESVQNMYISSVMLLKCIFYTEWFLFYNNDCFVFVANAKCFSFTWYNTKIFSQPLIYSKYIPCATQNLPPPVPLSLNNSIMFPVTVLIVPCCPVLWPKAHSFV